MVHFLVGVSQCDGVLSLHPVRWHRVSFCPVTGDGHFDHLIKVILSFFTVKFFFVCLFWGFGFFVCLFVLLLDN